MQILGLLGMYFDAVVVEVKTFLLLFRLALAIQCFGILIHVLSWNILGIIFQITEKKQPNKSKQLFDVLIDDP